MGVFCVCVCVCVGRAPAWGRGEKAAAHVLPLRGLGREHSLPFFFSPSLRTRRLPTPERDPARARPPSPRVAQAQPLPSTCGTALSLRANRPPIPKDSMASWGAGVEVQAPPREPVVAPAPAPAAVAPVVEVTSPAPAPAVAAEVPVKEEEKEAAPASPAAGEETGADAATFKNLEKKKIIQSFWAHCPFRLPAKSASCRRTTR